MYNGYNSRLFQDTNEPVGPRPNSSPYAFIFFLLYMCIMTLVLLNMFIGFVIVTFQEVGIKAFRESKLDRNQVCGLEIVFLSYSDVHTYALPFNFICGVIFKKQTSRGACHC